MTVQIATNRRGVPHATTLSRWATAAFHSAQRLYRTPQIISLTIRIVGAEESRKLNRTWRGKDKPTNVLSFPGDPLPAALRSVGRRSADSRNPSGEHALGDLAICAPVVLREAREQHKSAQSHWGHMVIHGVLHLLGYDHENERDAIEMEAREVEILSQFAYENPYV